MLFNDVNFMGREHALRVAGGEFTLQRNDVKITETVVESRVIGDADVHLRTG